MSQPSSSNSARDDDADAEVQTHALTRNAVVGLPLLEPNDCPKIKDDECEGTSQDTCGDHEPHAVDNVIIDQAPPYDCDDGASQGAWDDHEIPNTDKPIDNSSLAPSYFCAHSSESDSDTDNYQPDFFNQTNPLISKLMAIQTQIGIETHITVPPHRPQRQAVAAHLFRRG
jgi:hypothetical protein